MVFEDVLEKAGGFGFFNKTIMMAVLILGTFRTTLCYFYHLFVLLVPPSQWCFPNDTLHGFPEDVASLPRGKCQMAVASSKSNGSYKDATFFTEDGASCATGWVYDTAEFFTTASMEYEWVCSESWKLYAVHTTFWVGSMTGNLLCGFLADRIGRKKTLLILTAIASTANFAGAFSSDLVSFAVLKYFAGIGAFTVCSATFLLVMEYTVTRKRTFVAFVWATSWTVMAAVCPWYAYLLRSWRGLLISKACADLLLLMIVALWVPESSSWLLSSGRKQEAIDVLGKIARMNGKAMSQDELEELVKAAAKDHQVASLKPEGVPSFCETTWAILRKPRIRRITFLIYASWFAIALCYNGSTMELGRLNLNIYSTYSIAIAFELPVNLLVIMALDKLGRRCPNVVFMVLAGIVCLLMSLLRTESEALTLVMAVVIIMCFAGAYMITYQLASELFPTVIRGRAVLLQRVAGDIGGLLGSRVASLAENDTYIPILVMGVVSLVASVLLFFLPETVNHGLPQTLEDGENFGRDQGLCFCPMLTMRTQKVRQPQDVADAKMKMMGIEETNQCTA